MIDAEIKAIAAYLKATGSVKGKRRGRRKKADQAAPVKPDKRVLKAKPKAKRRQAAAKKTRAARAKKTAGTEPSQA
jgi:hypothetical protein